MENSWKYSWGLELARNKFCTIQNRKTMMKYGKTKWLIRLLLDQIFKKMSTTCIQITVRVLS